VTFDQVRGQEKKASWEGVLPGRPAPFFLDDGDGERSQVFDSIVNVLLSGDETEGQFGVFTTRQPKGDLIVSHSHVDVHEIFYVVEGAARVFLEHPDGRQESKLLRPGDFGYVPAGIVHSYRTEGEYNKILGVCTGGFERFFQSLGTLTEERELPVAEPYMPSPQQMQETFTRYRNIPVLDQRWEGA
jgi:quercetin 2,3-dioxygenase